ncbi:hypothetical protein BTJ39_18595 [Izhakiella australiensis]|uniref:Lysine transporter LysE n=1 Tax=Izhakiella australiensis TaxID=1926881 RepID=A0A1S8YHE1_9GAMM|nr:LysE family translocator [Izhakiella australiensis]OON38460.1 hypothetical protein BTJ39_18595 [Izhakiella australiensis]
MLDPSFFSYVTVMSITPGPNNMLLATSGVNFGFRRTVPLLSGITLGCVLQTVMLSLVLNELLRWMAILRLPLTVLGCCYLLWLSVKILRSGAPQMKHQLRPMGVVASTLFQLVNPKAWVMLSNVALLYSTQSSLGVVIVGFMMLNLPCILLWAWMGDRLGAHLQDRRKRQAFNILMALSLLATTLWMLLEAWSVR